MDHVEPPRSRERAVDNRKRCYNCNSHVTFDFARVFGDNKNRVYRCKECAEQKELFEGEGARP